MTEVDWLFSEKVLDNQCAPLRIQLCLSRAFKFICFKYKEVMGVLETRGWATSVTDVLYNSKTLHNFIMKIIILDSWIWNIGTKLAIIIDVQDTTSISCGIYILIFHINHSWHFGKKLNRPERTDNTFLYYRA